MGDNYNFYVNSDALLNLKNEISSKISVVESSLTAMENAVIAMGTQDGWVSDVYNILSEKFFERKEALEHAISYLKAYEATVAEAASEAEALSTAISNACASE